MILIFVEEAHKATPKQLSISPEKLLSRARPLIRSYRNDAASTVQGFRQEGAYTREPKATFTLHQYSFHPLLFFTDQVRLHCAGTKLFLLPFPSTLYQIHFVFATSMRTATRENFSLTVALCGVAVEALACQCYKSYKIVLRE